MISMMVGQPTMGGGSPTRFVAPNSVNAAQDMIIGTLRHFDYSNHDNVKKMARIYFDQGYPFEPHIGSIFNDLADLKTMRNACAHITSSTQNALNALALRIFGQPLQGVSVYRIITSVDPQSASNTIYTRYRNKLVAAATAMAQG